MSGDKPTNDFRAACEGEALGIILRERARQLGDKGFSRRRDAALSLTALPHKVENAAKHAQFYLTEGEHFNPHAALHWLARCGALTLAAIDRHHAKFPPSGADTIPTKPEGE